MDGDKIKKKIFTYARDIALEKINKTLDKKLAAAANYSQPSGNEAEPLQSKPRAEGRHSTSTRRRSREQEPNRRAEGDVDDVEQQQYVQRRHHHRASSHRRTRYSRVQDDEGSSADDGEDSADDQMTDLVEMSNTRRCHIYVANERRNSSRSHQLPKVASGGKAGGGGGGSDRGGSNGRSSIVLRKAPLPPIPQTYAPVPRRRSYDPAFLSQNPRKSSDPLLMRNRRSRNSRVRKSIFTEEDEDDFVTADGDSDDELDSDDSKDDSESDQNVREYPNKFRSSGITNGNINKYVYADIENQKSQMNKSSKLNRPQRQALSLDLPKYSRPHDEEHARDHSSQVRTPLSTPGLHVHGGTSTADYSGYIQKKSLAQGMMDLALLSANINQMRYLLEYKDNQPYFATSFTLVITSLFLQIAVSLTLIWNIRFNVKKRNEMKEADRVNNIGVMGIFLVTVINVALSTFGGAPAPKEIQVGVGMVTPSFDDGSGESAAMPEPIVFT